MTPAEEVAEMFATAQRVMTPNQYLVFWLHHHEGFSQYTIAKALGVARSTIQSRLVSGTARLVKDREQQEAA